MCSQVCCGIDFTFLFQAQYKKAISEAELARVKAKVCAHARRGGDALLGSLAGWRQQCIYIYIGGEFCASSLVRNSVEFIPIHTWIAAGVEPLFHAVTSYSSGLRKLAAGLG